MKRPDHMLTIYRIKIYLSILAVVLLSLPLSGCSQIKNTEITIVKTENHDTTPSPTVKPSAVTPVLTITPATIVTPDAKATPKAEVTPNTVVTPKVQATSTVVSSSVTLLAVGDNLIHEQVVESGLQSDGSYNFDHLYSRMRDVISTADIAVINQETILGGSDFPYSGYPNFNSPTEIGDAIIKAGFDVVLQATNHTLDMKYQGVKNTMAFWAKHPDILTLGINETKEKREQIPILEKNGIKIAMLNYTYSFNGHTLPADKPYLVNLLDKKIMAQDIAKAEKLADFTIVFPHWGTEYSYEADSRQKELTEFFYEHGVDLVIGSHPHVLEPVSWIQSDENRRMLVFYSLGNFLSYQKEAARMLGGIASVTITKDSKGTYISAAKITPIITHFEIGPADYNYGIYELKDYNEKLARRHGVNKLAHNGPLTYKGICDLAEQILGTWYRLD